MPHIRLAPHRARGRPARSTLLPLALSTTLVLRICRVALRSALDHARTIAEARAEQDVRIREEALFERDDNELCAAEPRAEERADVLRVREVERHVDLVKDVHQHRLELQQRHDQRERDE
jgi:hypothetical protein